MFSRRSAAQLPMDGQRLKDVRSITKCEGLVTQPQPVALQLTAFSRRHYSNNGFGVALAVGVVLEARTASTVPGRIDSTITSEIRISTLGLS